MPEGGGWVLYQIHLRPSSDFCVSVSSNVRVCVCVCVFLPTDVLLVI